VICFVLGIIVRSSTTTIQDRSLVASAPLQIEKRAVGLPEHNATNAKTLSTTNLDQMMEQVAAIDVETYRAVDSFAEKRMCVLLLEELAKTRPAEAARLLESAGSDIENLASLYENLVYQWSLTDPQQAYAWLSAQQDRVSAQLFNESMGIVLKNMAEENPQLAASYAESISDKDLQENTLLSVATQWVQIDHKSAFTWFESLSQSTMSNDTLDNFYSSMMSTLITKNPQLAVSLIGQLESKKLQANLIPQAAEALAANDLNAAFSWIKSLNNNPARLDGLEAIILSQSEEHPRDVVNLLLKQLGEDKNDQHLLALAFEALTIKDEGYALEQFDQLPKASQQTVARAVAYGMLNKGEEAAVEWINAQPPGKMLDGAASVMAGESLESDPVESVKWADKIGDPSERNRWMRTISMRARAESLPAIKEAIDQSSLSPDQLTLINGLIADRLNEEYAVLMIPVHTP